MLADDIRTIYPDTYGIKDALRQGIVQNPEFLDLTIMAYKLRLHQQKQSLSIADSIKTNENLSIFDHQILAAQKVKNDLGGSVILADEVGLGKTVEAGIIIKEFLVTNLATKVLVLAPPSLLPQWQDEMRSKFDLDFVMHRDDSRFEGITSHDLLLMSHSSAVYEKQSVPLNSVYWDMVIVDEAHSMKNSSTLKHEFVRNLPKRNLLLLTATPLQNNLEELYNLVDLLSPGCLGTWQQFQTKYVADDKARTVYPSLQKDLQNVLSRFIIRTTRREVRKYIRFTDRIPHTHILRPTSGESDLYDSMTDIVRQQYLTDADVLAMMIYQRLASSSTAASKRALYKMYKNQVISEETYHKLISDADSIGMDSKMRFLLDVMDGTDDKFLIFTEFYATQDYIAENLEKNGHSVTLFNGKMGMQERTDSVKRFREDSQVMVTTSAGGEGQNFQFCHNVVNYDLPWNPMRVEQRIGRVHRIGQQNNVNIYNLALEDTIEGYILELLYEKIDLFKMALGDMDLLFEDAWGGGSSQTWFKQYMDAPTKQDRKNRFTALGDDWMSRKENVSNAIQDFNSEVFKNFDLSVQGELE